MTKRKMVASRQNVGRFMQKRYERDMRKRSRYSSPYLGLYDPKGYDGSQAGTAEV